MVPEKVVVYNKRVAECLVVDVPHVYVSIRTPGDPTANLNVNEHTLKVLWLAFHDMDRVIEGYNSHCEPEMFQPSQARQILDVIAEFPQAQRIIFHCDAGLSRSPGAAAAIAKIVEGDDSYFFKHYPGLNRRVYGMILIEHYGRLPLDTTS